MKTKEVIKELEKMNLQTEVCGDYLNIIHCEGGTVAHINLSRKFEIDTDFRDFRHTLTEYEKEKVYVLLTKLAETDLSEREDEKKYYLRHKWFADDDCIYVNLCISENRFLLHSNKNAEDFKTQFTQAEIDEIKRKFNTSLEDFEIVEVEE